VIAAGLLALTNSCARKLGRYLHANEPAAKSIAVLPLLNESGDPKGRVFLGWVIGRADRSVESNQGTQVIGRKFFLPFQGHKKEEEEPKTIGEKLGVRTLLEGTVRKQGDRVRIVAELINAPDGVQLWSRTFERETQGHLCGAGRNRECCCDLAVN